MGRQNRVSRMARPGGGILLLLAALSNSALAYTWETGYGASLTLGREDNFRLVADSDDQIDTGSTDLGVTADIEGASEISRLQLSIAANAIDYSESEIEDENTYLLGLDTQRDGERASTFLQASVRQELTTETELRDTGANIDGTRDTFSIAPGLTYRADERSAYSAELGYDDVSYDEVSLTEYTNTSVSLSWRYGLEADEGVSIGYRISEYDPEDDDTTDINTVTLSYDFYTARQTAYVLSVGYSDVDRPEDSESGGNFGIEIEHQRDERNRFTFSLSSSFEGSGSGEVRDEDRLALNWAHGLSERSQFTLFAEAVDSKGSDSDRQFISIEAGGHHNLSRQTLVTARLRYRERDENSETADAIAVFVSLSYTSL